MYGVIENSRVRQMAMALRRWQELALSKWVESGCRGIVEVVTGGGKTVFALAALRVWRESNPEGAVLVLVPTQSLQDQWAIALEIEAGIPRDRICIWGEDAWRPACLFHVMVVNTARTKAQWLAERVNSLLVIADECHRYGSPENSKAIAVTKSASLGLTATAERDSDDALDTTLIPLLGEIIFKYNIEEAVRDEVVSDFDIVNVRAFFLPSEDERYKKLTRQLSLAYSAGDEARAQKLARVRATVSKSARMRLPVAVALTDRHRGERLLVFHEDIASATRISEILAMRGHRVALYHSKIGGEMRRDNLRLFRRGWIDVLVCCRALDEGIDVPEAEIAVIAASTSSSRQRVQRLGRVLRKAAGKDRATIYTLYVTRQEEENLLLEAQSLCGMASVRWIEGSVNNAANLKPA